MRRITTLFAMMLISVQFTHAKDLERLTPAERDVFGVANRMHDAFDRRDMASWSRNVESNCIFSSDDGILLTKNQIMERGNLPHDFEYALNRREYTIHVYGKTAIVNFRLTVHEQFTGSDIISEQRMTETYIKRGAVWQLVATQWGNLPLNFRNPVAIDHQALKDYVGEYEWRLGETDVVYWREGALRSRFEGDDDEYLPLGSDSFFIRNDLGTVSFSRDSHGHVIGYTYHRADGQEIPVRKVK